jgi:Protein of unknown function (DUF2905)
MQRWLITIGVTIVLIGVLWPWLTKIGLGRLPGDIRIDRDGFQFFFPITTGLIISIVLTVILWLLRK